MGTPPVHRGLMRVGLLLALLASPLAGAADFAALRQWGEAVTLPGATRIEARSMATRALVVYGAEGDASPLEYRYEPLSSGRPPDGLETFAYVDEPVPAIRWRGQTWTLAALAGAWRSTSAAWSWQDLAFYPLDTPGPARVCIEAGYAGLGRSGAMQQVRALMVLQATTPEVVLYTSGPLLSCRALFAVGDTTLPAWLAWRRDDSAEGYVAELLSWQGGTIRVHQRYRVEGLAGGGVTTRRLKLPCTSPRREDPRMDYPG